jgi:hypothetical protein
MKKRKLINKGELVLTDFSTESLDLIPIEQLWKHLKKENQACSQTAGQQARACRQQASYSMFNSSMVIIYLTINNSYTCQIHAN